MTAIPSGTKFVGIGASVPTPENKSSQNNAFQEVYTLEDLKESVLDTTTEPTEGDVLTYTSEGVSWVAPTGGSTATTTVVNITSAQIQSAGTTQPICLPALETNQYYTGNVQLEFIAGNVAYTEPVGETLQGVGLFFSGSENLLNSFDPTAFLDTNKAVFSDVLQPPRETPLSMSNVLEDFELDIVLGFIGTSGLISLEDGNGTIKLIFETQIRTFGA